MLGQRRSSAVRPSTKFGLPFAVPFGKLNFGEDGIDHAIENLVLVGYVVVDRHRLHAQVVRELADGECLDRSEVVGEFDRAGEDGLAVQSTALGGGGWCGRGGAAWHGHTPMEIWRIS